MTSYSGTASWTLLQYRAGAGWNGGSGKNYLIDFGTTNKTFAVDATGNAELAGSVVATNGFASYAPHTPVAVTVGASPFSYTNNTTTAQECYFSGGTAYSITKMGSAVYGSITGNDYFVLQPTNYCTITYTVAPTLFTNAW
jgi:hypothetical protein